MKTKKNKAALIRTITQNSIFLIYLLKGLGAYIFALTVRLSDCLIWYASLRIGVIKIPVLAANNAIRLAR